VYRRTDGDLAVCFESKGVVDDVDEGKGAVDEGEGERLRLKWCIAGVRVVWCGLKVGRCKGMDHGMGVRRWPLANSLRGFFVLSIFVRMALSDLWDGSEECCGPALCGGCKRMMDCCGYNLWT
jgi:hypothetical protein